MLFVAAGFTMANAASMEPPVKRTSPGTDVFPAPSPMHRADEAETVGTTVPPLTYT